MSHRWTLVAALLVALIPVPRAGAGPACAIVEGSGINGVQIGASLEAALAVTGAPVRQQTRGTQVVYDLKAPWAQMVAEYGVVQRVATRTAQCRTSRGVGPGAPVASVRAAYADAPVSAVQPGPSGDILTYPLIGVAFALRGDRVDAVEVFRGEGRASTRPAAPQPAQAQASPKPAPPGAEAAASPSPTPTTAPGAWSVRATSVRVEETDFIVSGTVENKGQALTAFAEVRAFSASGRRLGEGNSPLQPSPVPGGGVAAFEVRIPIDDIVKRYVVAIRPASARTTTLTEYSAEVKDPKIFAAIVARSVQVSVQPKSPNPTRAEFFVVVTNGSPFPLTSATVKVDITVTCRITAQLPPRFAQEVWSGTVTVEQLRPGASLQLPLSLSGGLCEGVAVSWSASPKVSDLKVGD